MNVNLHLLLTKLKQNNYLRQHFTAFFLNQNPYTTKRAFFVSLSLHISIKYIAGTFSETKFTSSRYTVQRKNYKFLRACTNGSILKNLCHFIIKVTVRYNSLSSIILLLSFFIIYFVPLQTNFFLN